MRKRGLTLVEMALVVAIIAIVTPVFYNLIDYQYKSFAMVEKKATENRHERMIYSIMHNRVRFAKAIKFFTEIPQQSDMNKKENNGYHFLWLDNGEIKLSTQDLKLKADGTVTKNDEFKARETISIAIKYGASDSHKIESLEFKRKNDKVLEYVYKGEGDNLIEGAIKLENKTQLPEPPKHSKKIVAIAYRPFYEKLDW